MSNGTSFLAVWFCSASNAALAAFTGLFSLRRSYPVVERPAVLAANTERLARRPASKEINLPLDRAIVELANIVRV
jgi:hypothetical protein